MHAAWLAAASVIELICHAWFASGFRLGMWYI